MNRGGRTIREFDQEADRIGTSALRASNAGCGNRRAGEEAGQIEEVAPLADDASRAYAAVLGPVITGDRTGVHGDDDGLGGVDRLEQGLHPDHVRREAPVEADHEARWTRQGRVQRLDAIDLGCGDGERLFDEDVPAGFDCPPDQPGVGIVTGCDDDSVDGRIGEDAVEIGGGAIETELPSGMRAREAAGGGDSREPCTGIAKCGDQDFGGIAAGADERDGGLGACCMAAAGCRRYVDRAGESLGRGLGGIIQHDPEVGLIGEEEFVSARGVGNREAVADEGRDFQRAGREHIEDGFEVALRGPADEGIRVVLAGFVGRIVAARAVRAGDLETQFLLVEIVA